MLIKFWIFSIAIVLLAQQTFGKEGEEGTTHRPTTRRTTRGRYPTKSNRLTKSRKYDDDDDDEDNEDYKKKGRGGYRDDDNGKYNNNSDDDDDNDDDDNDDEPYKPSYSAPKRRKPDSMGHMNIYIRDGGKKGKQKRTKRHRFPVARYERNRFPPFGPLVNFLPWMPIFVDRLTKQTIIYSPTGGVYILPPLINFFGKLISVGELIASGYASLVSSGVPPPPGIDVAPLVQPTPVAGPGVPPIDPNTGGFKGGVRTQYQYISGPKYPAALDENQPY